MTARATFTGASFPPWAITSAGWPLGAAPPTTATACPGRAERGGEPQRLPHRDDGADLPDLAVLLDQRQRDRQLVDREVRHDRRQRVGQRSANLATEHAGAEDDVHVRRSPRAERYRRHGRAAGGRGRRRAPRAVRIRCSWWVTLTTTVTSHRTFRAPLRAAPIARLRPRRW